MTVPVKYGVKLARMKNNNNREPNEVEARSSNIHWVDLISTIFFDGLR